MKKAPGRGHALPAGADLYPKPRQIDVDINRGNANKCSCFVDVLNRFLIRNWIMYFGILGKTSLTEKEEVMTGNRTSVKIQPKKGSEEAFFAERDRQKLRELRQRAAADVTKKYCEEHKYHCFRCGTQSLVEVDEGNVKIDICVNKNCGAIHLDPGELKKIIKDQGALSAAKNAFMSVFK